MLSTILLAILFFIFSVVLAWYLFMYQRWGVLGACVVYLVTIGLMLVMFPPSGFGWRFVAWFWETFAFVLAFMGWDWLWTHYVSGFWRKLFPKQASGVGESE